MGRIMDVSAKTIERWEQRDAAPDSRFLKERLATIDEITRLGQMIYTPEGFYQFMTTPMADFDNLTALQLFERGEGERVLAALAADYEGLGY